MTWLLMTPPADHREAFTVVHRKHFLGTHILQAHLGRGLTSVVTLAISSGSLDLAGLGSAGRVKLGNQLQRLWVALPRPSFWEFDHSGHSSLKARDLQIWEVGETQKQGGTF